jgi:hypothetical protein
MKLTSTGNSEITTNTNLATFNEVSGITYINPYKLCERCGKEEKNANSLFSLPNQCQCSSPKTDLELLQDEVNILKKKVNKLIKQQNKLNK